MANDGAVGAHHEDSALVARLGHPARLAQIPTGILPGDIAEWQSGCRLGRLTRNEVLPL